MVEGSGKYFQRRKESMNKLSDLYKTMKQNTMNIYFNGKYRMVSNQYFTFDRVIDEDNIIIVTDNVRIWKGQYVLIVDNNKVVYLKEWQVKEVKSWDLKANSYLVKLNRNYFKVYTCKFEIENVCFEKEDTFDSLVEVAKEQNKTNIKWAFGNL